MYETTQTTYGYRMVFGEFIDADEMHEWARAVRGSLDGDLGARWHCLVDMRDLQAMSQSARTLMSEVKTECHDSGLDRVVTVVEDTTTRLEFQQMSRGTGGTAERFIATSEQSAPMDAAEAWVTDGVEPPEADA
jgi:hypothetical protein